MAPRRRSNKPCLFCGRTNASSREHVIAEWVGKALDIKGRVEEYRAGVHVTTMDALSIVLRQVCVGCNTGWMSRLERHAKPILEPLLLGAKKDDTRVINPSQQATLATWAVKTSLLLAFRKFSGTEHGWIPMDNLEWLYKRRLSQLPPPCARVWIGGVDAKGQMPSSVQAACIYKADHVPAAHCGTFSLGYVVFQVFCCEQVDVPHPPEIERWLETKGPYHSSLLSITPSSSAIRWPPTEVFEIDALEPWRDACAKDSPSSPRVGKVVCDPSLIAAGS